MSTVDTNNKLTEDFLTDLCAHIAEGGTLVAFCREQSAIYKLVNRWINDDEGRASRYKLALDIREQHAKDLIVAELIAWIKAKPIDAFELVEDGNGNKRQSLRDLQDMPHELQRLVAAIEFEEIFEWQGEGKERTRVHVGRMHKIKFWDKTKTIETFMKHLAMLVDRKQVDVRGDLAGLIVGSMKPEAAKAA